MALLLMLSQVVQARGGSGQMYGAYELTDQNFEHDTQATTGSTTGDWLILFCEYERFARCRNYQPFWDELAGVLRGRVTVAYIDV